MFEILLKINKLFAAGLTYNSDLYVLKNANLMLNKSVGAYADLLNINPL